MASWLAKGYGTRYYAINVVTGQVIQGEEGAEVVLCANGLVRFIWKDADGNEVSADTALTHRRFTHIQAPTEALFPFTVPTATRPSFTAFKEASL